MFKNQPLVSVMIITYNRVHYLDRAIYSVQNQTYDNFELIIIDDGSEDNTAEMVKNLKDSRIQYYLIEHTGYISKNRNIGIDHSTGEYIAFLDSDDIWIREKLEINIKELVQNENCFALSSVVFFDNDQDVKHLMINEFEKSMKKLSFKDDIFEDIIFNRKSFYPGSTLVFPKKFLIKVGGLDTQYGASDIDFLVRMSYYYEALTYPVEMALIRRHDGNNSKKDYRGNFNEKFLLLDKLFKKGRISKKMYNRGMYYHYISYASIPTLTNNEILKIFANLIVLRWFDLRAYLSVIKIWLKRILNKLSK